MAKRKRSKTRTRRRRIGAVGKNNLMSAVGIIAGAVAARLVVKKVLPNMDERIKNAGVVAIGALVLPRFMKSDMGKAIGNGMIAAGGVGLVGSFLPALAGTGDTIEFPMTVGEIEDNLSVIAGGDDGQVMAGAGEDTLSVLAGMEDEEEY